MSEPSLADVVHEAVERAKADEVWREVTDTNVIWHYPHGSTLSIERSLLDPDDPAYLAC